MGKVVLPQGNIYEVNPYGYNLDKVFYACCNAIVRAKGEASSEEKLAVFLVLIAYKNSSPKLLDFICKLASNFAFGHFMDIRKINALLPVITISLKNALVSIDNNE
ncbi:hypothetical protein GE278_23850 (plasmid) [Enterobacteriaceae bacterium Kacie_13]|nr:hypothetical protein GE278_23850 [Enterobacteriaceae bacterium Kacie_13]